MLQEIRFQLVVDAVADDEFVRLGMFGKFLSEDADDLVLRHAEVYALPGNEVIDRLGGLHAVDVFGVDALDAEFADDVGDVALVVNQGESLALVLIAEVGLGMVAVRVVQ